MNYFSNIFPSNSRTLFLKKKKEKMQAFVVCVFTKLLVAALSICKKEVNLNQSSYSPLFLINCDRFGATH